MQVQLLCTIAKVYKDIGMIRKYCYYLRSAAMESLNDRLLSRAYSLSSSIFCEIIERYGVLPDERRATGCARLQVTGFIPFFRYLAFYTSHKNNCRAK